MLLAPCLASCHLSQSLHLERGQAGPRPIPALKLLWGRWWHGGRASLANLRSFLPSRQSSGLPLGAGALFQAGRPQPGTCRQSPSLRLPPLCGPPAAPAALGVTHSLHPPPGWGRPTPSAHLCFSPLTVCVLTVWSSSQVPGWTPVFPGTHWPVLCLHLSSLFLHLPDCSGFCGLSGQPARSPPSASAGWGAPSSSVRALAA